MQIEEIGIIGMGDMGKTYGRNLSNLGFKVNASDLPQNRKKLEAELEDSRIELLDNGHEVTRRSDVTIYAVEAENIGKVVSEFASSTKQGSIVSRFTSVKTPEIKAFERYLPEDVHIVACHPLHGPGLNVKGKIFATFNHRASDEAYESFREMEERLGVKTVEIEGHNGVPAYVEHDKISADTQAATHAGFLSMGTAWKRARVFPWENPFYKGGIDNIKVLMTLRVLGGKSHVYGGLAILNDFAREQIKTYATSVSDLFKLTVQEKKEEFASRVRHAGNVIFNNGDTPLILDDEIMDELGLGDLSGEIEPNSHLSLLGMVDSWARAEINPYKNLICQTPPFKLRVGIAEYLFRKPELLNETIGIALDNRDIRGDDVEFVVGVSQWADLIDHRDLIGYKEKFDETRKFYPTEKLEEAKKVSDDLIERLSD